MTLACLEARGLSPSNALKLTLSSLEGKINACSNRAQQDGLAVAQLLMHTTAAAASQSHAQNQLQA
jgi:predicted FMN-binding regulatory protein PaiB